MSRHTLSLFRQIVSRAADAAMYDSSPKCADWLVLDELSRQSMKRMQHEQIIGLYNALAPETGWALWCDRTGRTKVEIRDHLNKIASLEYASA